MEVINYILKNKQILASDGKFEGIKIVFFSDLHIGKLLKKRQLQKVLQQIRSLNADIYIFGGDLIGSQPQKYYTIEDIKECFSIFNNSLNIKVFGNHEFKVEKGIDSETKIKLFMAMENFKLLRDEKISFYKNDLKINIIGLNEVKYHQVKLPEIDKNETNIAIVHQGDYFDKLADFDLTMSGHTHGGQIRLPLLKPFYLPSNGKKYVKGLFKNKNVSLIVSKGLGCNYVNFRMFAKRDVIVIDYRG